MPWQNGKVERFNRTLALEWAYRQPFTRPWPALPSVRSPCSTNGPPPEAEGRSRVELL